jgi:hypothetical protein
MPYLLDFEQNYVHATVREIREMSRYLSEVTSTVLNTTVGKYL